MNLSLFSVMCLHAVDSPMNDRRLICCVHVLIELCDEMASVEIVTSYEELVRRHVVGTLNV